MNKISQVEFNKIECTKCGQTGFRIIDKRNNQAICITCRSPYLKTQSKEGEW